MLAEIVVDSFSVVEWVLSCAVGADEDVVVGLWIGEVVVLATMVGDPEDGMILSPSLVTRK